MRKLSTNPNVDNSDPANYLFGRIKNSTGASDGTPVDERVYGDYHQMIAKLMTLYGIEPNDLPDNETNGYQIVDALRALASKNDFVLPLTSVSGVLSVPIKLNAMLDGESVDLKASANWTTETQIKGSDNVTLNFTKVGNFKANEYVQLIKTGGTVTLIRLANYGNIDSLVTELLYLKKASQAQENAGTSDLVATTPLVNKTTFTRRVNGLDSSTYLATASQNGLLSKEDKAILDLGNNVKNIGAFSGLNIGEPAGQIYTCTGDATNAVSVLYQADTSSVEVTFANPMPNLNYFVRIHIQSDGTWNQDWNLLQPIVKPLTTTKFRFGIVETQSNNQNLKVYFEVVKF